MTAAIRRSFTGSSQAVLLGLCFAVLVAVNGASLLLLNRSQSNYENVVHTLDVENQLANLLRTLRRAESTQRGYLLTESQEQLKLYRDAAASVPRLLEELRRSTADNPVQQELLRDLDEPIRARLNALAQVVAAREEAGLDAAIKLIASGDTEEMAEARAIVEKIMEVEAGLLQERTARAEGTTFQLFAINLAGSALILAVGTIAFVMVRRSTRQRDEANERLAAANFDLEASIAERTAELEEANQELQRYAYIVSHDLRSPLVNIMGFTTELEELRSQIFDSERERPAPAGAGTESEAALVQSYDEALGFIKASISRMDGLINAILRLSREGQRQFKPETIDMNEFMGSVTATFAHQADEAGAEIVVEDLPPIVGDRLALEQIFSNLLDNALKYLDGGRTGRIIVRGRKIFGFNVYEVEDNGRGILEKDHRRIFDLFRRSGAQDRPGEGIGLAHVRALVRRLGGRISVKSEPGQGSVFTVTLPQQWAPTKERTET
jgi:signal transduction histidine kinase